MKTFLDASALVLLFAVLATGLAINRDALRDWYRRWVQVREIRYRALAEILDDIDKRRR